MTLVMGVTPQGALYPNDLTLNVERGFLERSPFAQTPLCEEISASVNGNFTR